MYPKRIPAFLLIFSCILISRISFSQSEVNYCISFPGGTNGAISSLEISGLNLKTLPYTIEMWFKPDGSQVDNAGLIYHRGTGNAGVQYSSSWQGSGKIRFMSNIPGDYGTVTDYVTPGVWHHVAVVLTSTTRTVYLDDKVYAQQVNSTDYDFSAGKLYIGWDNAIANRTFKGQIDEVRIWNSARTKDEILASRFKKLTGSENGLTTYWNFDDQNLASATDLTSHGLNGILNGVSYSVSTFADTMVLKTIELTGKNLEINSPSINNIAARIHIATTNKNQPLDLTSFYLDANGTTSLSDIAGVNIYYTGNDSTFSPEVKIAGSDNPPDDKKFRLSCSRKLTEGSNYIWITYDIAGNVPKGNVLEVSCDSVVLTGSSSRSYIPVLKTEGRLTVNPGLFMPFFKFTPDVVTTNAETPSGGANFVSFQQNAVMSYKGYQYVTYWNHSYHVCIARKKMSRGKWEILEFTDYTVTASRIADNHYSISMGICPNDGTIHLAFDHHGDVLHYRKSVPDIANKPGEIAWSPSSFGAKQESLIPGQQMTQVTYPRFAAKPNGDLLFEYRFGTSGGGDSYIYEYSGSTGNWTRTGKYIDGLTLSNNAYLNGITYDQNSRLHASWVWRETPDPLTNHDICYMYSDDHGKTWKSHDGTLAGTADANPVKSNTNGIKVWSVGQNRGLINQESQTVDSRGGVHFLQSFLLQSEPNSTNFWNGRNKAYLRHIYKDDNGIWQNDVIDAISVNRSQIAVDEGDNLYVVAPNYRIFYAAASEKWKKWTAFDLSGSAGAINEGLIDRELLRDESVLSFVFAGTGGKIMVPYYLVDKSKPGKGKGLQILFSSSTGMVLSQKLSSVDISNQDITYSGDSVNIECKGIIETMFSEPYTLHLITSGKTLVWINDTLVLNTGTLYSASSFPVILKMQPWHKYNLRITGRYATGNVLTKLEWESKRQPREPVSASALYGTLTDTGNVGIEQLSSGELMISCQPNPFTDNIELILRGSFDYQLYTIQGRLIQADVASDHLTLGAGLATGVYILRVTQGQKSRIIKIAKN